MSLYPKITQPTPMGIFAILKNGVNFVFSHYLSEFYYYEKMLHPMVKTVPCSLLFPELYPRQWALSRFHRIRTSNDRNDGACPIYLSIVECCVLNV